MDALVGDGDIGIGASRASKMVLANIDKLDFQNNLAQSVVKISDLWSDGFGGSSGPLWNSFLTSASTMLKASLAENTAENWASA
mmetsp:Transcript_45768/g.38554  ORF Transcript_45768/g.38554 Transcript_45768/m.38554 type:complete len:84 (+) Transcript_45768:1244-1495(+)